MRDAYFPTLAILNKNLLNSTGLRNRSDYHEQLSAIMNDTRKETIDESEQKLKEIRQNVYSFETDSGKADMITGKVVANLQWSGDGVYTMDQAEEDDYYLDWAVPEECTNLWFDGWVMLKSGIGEDAAKKQAAEAFINFLSRRTAQSEICITSAIHRLLQAETVRWSLNMRTGLMVQRMMRKIPLNIRWVISLLGITRMKIM